MTNPRAVVIVLVATLAVVASVRRYLPDLLSPWHFEDDARQHVWWTYRLADPSLFPNDRAADYFSAPTFAPLGYRALAHVFVPHVDAQTFSEIVPFFLTAAVAALAIMLGLAVSGGSWLGAAVAGVFALQGGVLARVEGGLPRSWAMPVLLFGVWTVLQKRWGLLGLALVLTAVFYPPLIVNVGLFGGAAFVLDALAARRPPRGLLPMAVLGIGAAAIVVVAYKGPANDEFGPRVSEAVARAMPEFSPEGRSRVFSPDPIDFYVSDERSGLGFEPVKLAAFLAVIALLALALPGAAPRVVWLLPLTALIAFVAAHLVLFALHLPSRYVRFALPAFLLVWLAAIVPAAVARLRAFPAFARGFAAITRPRVAASLLVAGVAAIAVEAALHARKDLARAPAAGYPDLIEFLRTLPPGSLVAAHPADASNIPLLARISVSASEETSMAYYLGYYGPVKARITAELEACYASDWAAVDALASQGVDHFVVDRARYRKPIDRKKAYYEPFRSALAPMIARGETDGFVLDGPPPDRVVYDGGRFLVVKVQGPR